MKYTIDENQKTLTLEIGTWEISKFADKMLELSEKYKGYKICIEQKIQLVETGPINPINPWQPTPNNPYTYPYEITCTSNVKS